MNSSGNSKIIELLKKTYADSNDFLSFADFMRIALYTPNEGYYMRQHSPFNETGDFITAPLLTPLFGRALAKPLSQCLNALNTDQVNILELGAGTGALAASLIPEVIKHLQHYGKQLNQYAILELSGTRRSEQQALLKEKLSESDYQKIAWWGSLPEQWQGALVANEVLDALPVHRVCWEQGQYWEVGVGYDKNTLQWSEKRRMIDHSQAYDTLLLQHAERYIPAIEHYISELHLEAQGLISTLAKCINRGAMLWIDYGFDAAQYYHPQRDQGTLRMHERHTSHDGWWHNIGNIDITAHVNFEGIAENALEEGWKCELYSSQADFLLQSGLIDLLSETSPDHIQAYAKQAGAVQKLVSPAEMGELFKVLLLSRDISIHP